MKITIVCDVLGEENNGTTIAAMNLIRFLKSKGHELSIVCPDIIHEGEEGYYIVPVYNLGPFNNYVKKNGVSLAKVDYNILYEAVKDADIVHIMIPLLLGIEAANMCHKMGKPITAGFHMQAENLTAHFGLKNVKLASKITYKAIFKLMYRFCDGIHYPTQFIRDIFEKEIGPTNGYVISNGVNKIFVKKEVSKPEELKDKYVVLFTGRYSKEKSHMVLIKAVMQSAYEKNIQLIFAGDGPLKNKLKKYCSKHLTNQPIMKFYSRQELIDVINYADLYVHPAEVEIEAIACLEALSCGLVPVIANSPRCATKSFALTENNLFINRDSTDLKNKIDYWLSNDDARKEMSERYLGYASIFEHTHCMEEMEKMLIEVSKKG